MLKSAEEKEISDQFARYERKSAVCIEALRIVQRGRGWVSDEAIRDIARFLEMSPDDVDGVATFYNLIFRKPVGRRVLFVCDSVSCWVMGCGKVKAALQAKLGVGLGETSSDGAVTVLPIACLGACDKAPVVMLGPGIGRGASEETLFHFDVEAIDPLLARLRQADEVDLPPSRTPRTA